ncbi:MAG: hypothetical protein WC515_04620 [Candidatus Omnitrophota bacterium]
MNANEPESIFRSASPEELRERALQHPNILSNDIRVTIERKIVELETEYQHTQGLILTESDLKCLLYNKLAEIPVLRRSLNTRDSHIKANSIHTELPWYDENRKLTIKPDITLLEPAHLSILHGYGLHPWQNLPSKGCSFSGNAIIFELKFIRARSGITQQKLRGSIKKDHRKIERLFIRLNSEGYSHNVFCYFVIFNKTNKKCAEFDDFMNSFRESNKYKMIYATGGID